MSLTIIGWLSGVIAFVFSWANIPVAPEALEGFVTVLGGLFAVVAVYWGRYRQKDIYWWGGRK